MRGLPSPIKNLDSGVGLGVLADGRHDEADGEEECGKGKPLGSPLDVKDLGKGQLE